MLTSIRDVGPVDDCAKIAGILAAVSELGRETDQFELFRGAVDFARGRLGLERVGIYLHDAETETLRGTWGTGLSGETLAERSQAHSLPSTRRQELLELNARGRLWVFHDHRQQCIRTSNGSVVNRLTWLAVTPLVSSGELLGVMYNDGAIRQGAMNPEAQRLAAMFCGLLANLLSSRGVHQPADWVGVGLSSNVLKRALAILEADPLVSGQKLAAQLNVSAGYLGRCFKEEIGVSLVEYRNRLRLRRLRQVVEAGERNLLTAALRAGFGSYAQFHRVYRQLVGGSPRDLVRGRRQAGTGTHRASSGVPGTGGAGSGGVERSGGGSIAPLKS